MALSVTLNWGVGSFFGWGVYGLSLALNWAADPDIEVACPHTLLEREIVVDPLRRRALGAFARRSAQLRREILIQKPTAQVSVEGPVLVALDQRFEATTVEGVTLLGAPNIGVTFFQDTGSRRKPSNELKSIR